MFKNCDILGLTETWHLNDLLINKVFEKTYFIFESHALKEKSKGRPSGGIALLVKKNIVKNKVKLIEKSSYYIIAELSIGLNHIIIGIFYMSPSLCNITCNNILDESLLALTKYKNSCVIIMGDFNSRFGTMNQIINENCAIENDILFENRLSNDTHTNKRGILMVETFESY
jgi:hypothetical protein